jgi:general secretion pathway protein H
MGLEVTRSRGYTLIELVLVMAVLAAASMVAVPAIGRGVDGLRVRTEVAGVASFLRSAREQAVTRGQTHEVTLDAARGALVVRRVGGKSIADGATRRQLSSRLHVAPEPGRILQPITFLPQGRSSGGAFRVEAVGSRAYVISVDPLTGRVSTRRADS